MWTDGGREVLISISRHSDKCRIQTRSDENFAQAIMWKDGAEVVKTQLIRQTY